MSVIHSDSPSKPVNDLEARVADRKRDLISEIMDHKRNSSRAGATEAVDRIKARLSELAHIVKGGVVDGWANIGPATARKLDAWLAR